jgi:hypothetical protein
MLLLGASLYIVSAAEHGMRLPINIDATMLLFVAALISLGGFIGHIVPELYEAYNAKQKADLSVDHHPSL